MLISTEAVPPSFMTKTEGDLLHGIQALPAFPLVLVMAGRYIMTLRRAH